MIINSTNRGSDSGNLIKGEGITETGNWRKGLEIIAL